MPEKILIANNIITGSSGQLIDVLGGEISFSNNIVYPKGSASVGDIPSDGYLNVNPLLATLDGIFRPSSSSPAIDAASSMAGYRITTDMDGQARNGTSDIGADEVR
jgi:hypothetical protein